MSLSNSLMRAMVFDEDGNIAVSHTGAVDFILASKPEGVSVVDAYLKTIVLPCGSVFKSGLQELQRESMSRLGYKVREDWQKSLRGHLTWHDVVLWLSLVDLTEKFLYNPLHDELDMLKAIYSVCNEKESRKFKVIYGMFYLPLPSK